MTEDEVALLKEQIKIATTIVELQGLCIDCPEKNTVRLIKHAHSTCPCALVCHRIQTKLRVMQTSTTDKDNCQFMDEQHQELYSIRVALAQEFLDKYTEMDLVELFL